MWASMRASHRHFLSGWRPCSARATWGHVVKSPCCAGHYGPIRTVLSGTSGSLLQLRYWLKHDYCFFNGVQRRRHWYNLFLLRRISWLNGRNRFSDGPSAILTGLCSWSKGKPVMALYFGIRMVHSWWLVMDSCWLLRTQRPLKR